MQRWQGLDEVPDDWGRPSSPSASSTACTGATSGSSAGPSSVARAQRLGGDRGSGRGGDVRPAPGRGGPARLPPAAPVHHPAPAELLAGLGADAVCLLPFTIEFSRLGPDEFVRDGARRPAARGGVVVGEDFRFGHKAAGDVPLLAALGEKYDFTRRGGAAAGRRRRHDLVDLHPGAARRRRRGAAPPRVLGRPHRVEGIVVRGAPARPRSSASPPPTWRRRRTRRSRPTASTRAGCPAWTRTAREAAGPPRSRSAPTRPSTGPSARSRPTPWTATTSTCTARTSPSTSPPGSAARARSTRSRT